MISGFWPCFVLLALSATATLTQQQQQQNQQQLTTTLSGSGSSSSISESISRSIEVGGGGGGGGGTSNEAESLSLGEGGGGDAIGAASNRARYEAAAGSSSLSVAAVAIETEAHDDLKKKKLGAAGPAKRDSEEEEKVIAALEEAVIAQRAPSPSLQTDKQQVNITSGAGEQQQSAVQEAASWKSPTVSIERDEKLQAAPLELEQLEWKQQQQQQQRPPLSQAAAAAPQAAGGNKASISIGGFLVDEKVQPATTSLSDDVEHNHHDHHEQRRRRRHQNNSTNYNSEQVTPSRAVESLTAATAATTTTTTTTTSSRDERSRVAGKGPVVYTNQFVLEVKGGEEEARKLAEKHGFVYLNHILADFYHLEHRRLSKRSLSSNDLEGLQDEDGGISIRDEPQVLLLERQVLKRRVKRDFIDLGAPPPPASSAVAASTRLGRAHSSQVRPPNQPRPPPTQHQQLLRAPGSPSSQPAPPASGRIHTHPPTRPANQAPSLAHQRLSSSSSPNLAAHRIASGHLDLSDPGALLDSLEVSASTPPINFGGGPSQLAGFNRQQQQQNMGPIQRFYNNNNNQNASASTTTSTTTTQSPLKSSVIVGQHHDKTTLVANNDDDAAAVRSGSSSNSSFNDSSSSRPFNDPSWPLMWYLDGGAKNGFDLNVMAAWKMGYTGKGIVITILDDGLEKDHPDLQANYDPLASFDINGDDADPMPRYDVNDSNRHGTRCAGEVAAVPDNNICSIGIAYNSKVGGVRMLDGDVTDAVEARSLALNNQHIHIYSASWGPDDNGKTVDGPGEMATRAFVDGVTRGRQGLGSIFVFASGNGGREHDNCNCDGYTNSIWTLSISSATENGYVPWYIEACSSTLATTYSSGSYEERQIATTDLHHSCTSSHTGTSASAPLAAGICALVLESNPLLTWRDMQHIVVRTAKPANLVAKDWRTNALGRNVSHAFGYGLMDAAAMILMAKQWTTVPDQYTCRIKAPSMEKPIPARSYIELKLNAQCNNISYLEHVQSMVTLSASRRGDLHIYLVSPGGTRSTLLAQRPNDHAEQGFRNWPFMTVHNWGESPNGIWTLEVHNDGKPQNRAHLKEWTLMLYGTKEDPNNHLTDSMRNNGATPSSQPVSPQPPPSPPIEHQKNAARPPAPLQPSTAPPPPITMNQRPAPEVASKPAATAPPPQPPQQHWSTYSSSSSPLPPPPLPPLASGRLSPIQQPANLATTSSTPSSQSSSSTSTTSTSSSLAATTQASYDVTTFNSLVSRPPPPSGAIMKADFDIVLPASDRRPSSNLDSILQPTSEEPASKQTIRPPTMAGETSDEPNITKPPVDSMDSQSPESSDSPHSHQHSSSSSSSSSSGSSSSIGDRPLQPTTGTSQEQTTPSNPPDLEGGSNQIDLKLSKDYRSSGDQTNSVLRSQLGPISPTNPGGQEDHQLHNSKQAKNQQKLSSSGGAPSYWLLEISCWVFVIPALLSALMMHHQLDQLVRHSIDVI